MAPARRARTDGGFSLVETIVAVSLIGVVMAALVPFLVTSLRVLAQQGDRQAAVQLADSAMERVRAIDLPAPGKPLPLPEPTSTTLDDLAYAVSWTQAACGRPAATDADCAGATSGDVGYYRVTVTVTWPDNRCPLGSCTYRTATLVNTDADPLFETL